jgi:hypothetical protein
MSNPNGSLERWCLTRVGEAIRISCVYECIKAEHSSDCSLQLYVLWIAPYLKCAPGMTMITFSDAHRQRRVTRHKLRIPGDMQRWNIVRVLNVSVVHGA